MFREWLTDRLLRFRIESAEAGNGGGRRHAMRNPPTLKQLSVGGGFLAAHRAHTLGMTAGMTVAAVLTHPG